MRQKSGEKSIWTGKSKWTKDSRCILRNEAGIKIFLYLVSKMGAKPVYA